MVYNHCHHVFERNLFVRDHNYTIQKEENAVLVGLISQYVTEQQAKEYIDELTFLAMTAGAKTVKFFLQKLPQPDKKTFVGRGKLLEILEYIKLKNVHVLIFDDELSLSQVRNIQDIVQIKVIDRSALILDIFAQRARTAQAKVQVELAQYQYLLPRLKGLWKHLERQGGGIGSRGPGESEIETDRRIVQNKISCLKRQLHTVAKQALTQRKGREQFIRVAFVGYTNVGKSTLMNVISKSEVLAENKLFATVTTTTRKVTIEGTPFLLSDTVGFIRKLPHHLIESFKSTLEEVRESDILLHIVDMSHPQYEEQIQVVQNTLQQLHIAEKRMILVLNKMDIYVASTFDEWTSENLKQQWLMELKEQWATKMNMPCLLLSAVDGYQIQAFKDLLIHEIKKLYTLRYPYKTSYFNH